MKNMTKADAKAFIREIMGPPRRTLAGTEYNNVWLMLLMVDPDRVTNNQHTMTEEYHVNRKEYHVTYFPGDSKPEIEEILKDKNEHPT